MHVYMVTGCPDGFGNEILIQKCLANDIPRNEYTYHLDVPVRSESSGKVYSNIFCAMCHGDSENITKVAGHVICNNEDLIQACGISVRNDILVPDFYNPTTRTKLRLDVV